jgi:hypothetical protein
MATEIPEIEYLDRTFGKACLRCHQSHVAAGGRPCWDAACRHSEYRMWAAQSEQDPGDRYVDSRA